MLQPKRNIGDKGWHNFIVPLEKFSGKTVYLTFSTSGSGEDLSYCWSAWGWGKIIRNSNYFEKTTGLMSNDQLLKKDLCEDIIRFSDLKTEFGNKKAEI